MGCRIAAAESDDGGLDGGGLGGSQWKGSGVEAGGWRVGWGPNLSQNVRVGFFPGRCLPGAREVRAGKAASPLPTLLKWLPSERKPQSRIGGLRFRVLSSFLLR